MELQAIGHSPVAKGLVPVAVTRGQPDGAVGDLERVAVPLDDGHPIAFGTEHGVGSTLGSELDLTHADLGRGACRHRCPQGGGQQLCAQAHSQHGDIRPDDLGDPPKLGLEPRESIGVVHPHGASHDDHPTQILGCWKRLGAIDTDHRCLQLGGGEHPGEKSRAFVRRVLGDDPQA